MITWLHLVWYDIFNCIWVDTRWQLYRTHYTQTVHRTTQSTQTVHRTTQLTSWEECGSCPTLRGIPWLLSYNWGKSTEILTPGSRRISVGMMKTENTEQRIQILRRHKHNNKNTQLKELHRTIQNIQPYTQLAAAKPGMRIFFRAPHCSSSTTIEMCENDRALLQTHRRIYVFRHAL